MYKRASMYADVCFYSLSHARWFYVGFLRGVLIKLQSLYPLLATRALRHTL